MKTNSLTYTDGDKSLARKELARMRADIASNTYADELCKYIASLPEYKCADTVLLYFPTRSEPNLTPLFDKAIADGKLVAFPISRTEDNVLDFRSVDKLDELVRGAYGIREPSDSASAAPLSERTLCIVPALAVDADGYRLGYGKGYYDRFLYSFAGASIVALHSSLVCARLPRLATDVPIKTIITETGVTRIDEITL